LTFFLLDNNISVAELEIAKRTGSVLKTPVGKNFLGRVVNALGKPLDALGEIVPDSYEPIEATVPSIIERSLVNQSLETGILAIDALIPIGKGQRELIIGNRSTGKSAIAIDTILHQRNQNVICIYVSIGLRQANLAKLLNC